MVFTSILINVQNIWKRQTIKYWAGINVWSPNCKSYTDNLAQSCRLWAGKWRLIKGDEGQVCTQVLII